MDDDILLQRKPYADFAHQERAEVSATTRSQTKPSRKECISRTKFLKERPKLRQQGQSTKQTQVQRPSAEVRHEPTADAIDPVTVQEERRPRIAKAQDEELRWSNLKAVLRGETTAMTYKQAVANDMEWHALMPCCSLEPSQEALISRKIHKTC
ncbi:LOW QUALITY PROTEIN: hypothetical protein PHMEG_00028313 [Phytophthora megakarya]|uniref:Uncharacterized protein n=1 Tax=Phytophthora megakarya TaxID=4795 RepID=A0A225V584_9STRA|nr:LOW QUALITY PROTEIN: hypothetical protein PHMEG_00028313 [Phytophthora megakarya]